MRNKQIFYTATQREKNLIELIRHAKKFSFHNPLIESYEQQLKEVQAEVKRDKEKAKKFNKKLVVGKPTLNETELNKGLVCREIEVLK